MFNFPSTCFYDRCCNCSLCAPSATHSRFNGMDRNVKFLSPFTKSLLFTPKRHINSFPCVFSLLPIKYPHTVFGSVVTININTLYRMFTRRSFAHVFKKVVKVFKPAFTHFNSSPTIVRITGTPLGITTPLYAIPNLIFRGVGTSVFRSGASVFFIKTALAGVRTEPSNAALRWNRINNYLAVFALHGFTSSSIEVSAVPRTKPCNTGAPKLCFKRLLTVLTNTLNFCKSHNYRITQSHA